ncbi:MAG: hypothetical protein ACJA2C_002536 [Marinoscillum sp.]|jgi:hypothetical protein
MLATPSAYFMEDKTFLVGSSFLHKEHLEYGSYQYHALAGYASLTFLPFMEVTFRFTGQMREISEENNNFPDRMPSVRVRLFKETGNLPAIAVGMYDLSSVRRGNARHFASTFIVTSKTWDASSLPVDLETHLGYGFETLEAKNHELSGVFGSVGIASKNYTPLRLVVEYDSKNLNSGLKILLWRKLQLMALLRQMQHPEASISFRSTIH